MGGGKRRAVGEKEWEQLVLEELREAQSHLPDYLLRYLWPQVVASTRKDLFFSEVRVPVCLWSIFLFPLCLCASYNRRMSATHILNTHTNVHTQTHMGKSTHSMCRIQCEHGEADEVCVPVCLIDREVVSLCFHIRSHLHAPLHTCRIPGEVGNQIVDKRKLRTHQTFTGRNTTTNSRFLILQSSTHAQKITV